MHYKRLRRRGTAHDITPEERFFARVSESSSGCWVWDRPTNNGYGHFGSDGLGPQLAHRWSYQYMRAEIPDGLELDHLCRNRACVNPWHLEPVTRSVNMRRAFLACPNGHAYDEANTEIHVRGHRQCRRCRIDRTNRASSKRLATVGG